MLANLIYIKTFIYYKNNTTLFRMFVVAFSNSLHKLFKISKIIAGFRNNL